MIRVLIVDHRTVASDLERNLSKRGCRIIAAETRPEADMILKQEKIDIAIIGTKLPAGGDGVALLRKLKMLNPSIEIIMLVGHASIDATVRSMKLGAYDCIAKPANISELSESVQNAYKSKCLREGEGKVSKENEVEVDPLVTELVGESKQMREVKKLISLIGSSRAPVLILGETGTGKEVVARAIHRSSDRSVGPFVTVNASALPDNILESELFGYKKGAFTGAESDKAGLLDVADRGTFFADEVGDMNLAMQAKLLRVIETGTFRKLGDTRERRVNIRLVSATNKDLEEEVSEKNFRADLFYRLSTFLIHVPPLRERKEDIPLLVDHFLRKISRGRDPVGISAEALILLINYPWPGNVRELAHMLERTCIINPGVKTIEPDTLPLDLMKNAIFRNPPKKKCTSIRLIDAAKQHIENVLQATDGNKSEAARILGISRTKLYAMFPNERKRIKRRTVQYV